MANKLKPEEIVTLLVLKSKGQSNSQIARTLDISEGAVRYHVRNPNKEDGRKNKPRKADAFAQVIDDWITDNQPDPGPDGSSRPLNVHDLHDWLALEHDYKGSYKSVLRYLRDNYPKPRLRPHRRVETPPAAQAQVDWGEFADLDIGAGPQKLYAFLMLLSHSRKAALIWSQRMDQSSWHHAHNLALCRLGGVPAVLRIDNLKTGISKGAGPWGEINDAYRSYARCLGFHVDACLPRCPQHKGKVENLVRQARRRLRLGGSFSSLDELQQFTDQQLDDSDTRRLCPITGLSVQQTFEQERPLLRPLPILPEPFDLVATRTVGRDCTVNFEGRSYSVPFVLCGLTVEVRGCASLVQVWHEGKVVAQHPRHSQQRLLIEPAHYEGEGDERVMPPVPLGRMGQRLQQIMELPVEKRPLDLYAALAEVAR